jgi:hypothetical protein
VQLYDPPDYGFLEAETYVGAFQMILRKPYTGFFLNKMHLVGGETLI